MTGMCRCGHGYEAHLADWCLTLSNGSRPCEVRGCSCSSFFLVETLGEAIKRMYPDAKVALAPAKPRAK